MISLLTDNEFVYLTEAYMNVWLKITETAFETVTIDQIATQVFNRFNRALSERQARGIAHNLLRRLIFRVENVLSGIAPVKAYSFFVLLAAVYLEEQKIIAAAANVNGLADEECRPAIWSRFGRYPLDYEMTEIWESMANMRTEQFSLWKSFWAR